MSDIISGSVVTFNSAHAGFPLKKCEVAFSATQEGSGDPSPSNVRPIVGVDNVNVTIGSGNLYNGTFGGYNELSLKAGKQLILQSEMDNDVYLVLRVYDENKTFLQSVTTTTGTGTRYGMITLNRDISYYRIERSSQSGVYNNIMLSLGTTLKPYTPYVTPTIYTIQLGQEVYGAEVDVVNGVAHCTHKKKVFDGTFDASSANWQPNADSVGWYYNIDDVAYAESIYTPSTSISDCLKSMSYADVYGGNVDSLALSSSSIRRIFMRVRDTSLTTKQAINEWLALNPITVVYPLAEPFDIQLTPTQIETLIGNNTIFADTGDISVDATYNFNEIFKLPAITTDTASGSVATFNSDYAGLPLKGCTVDINAWQEGSGDPYPAGGSAQQWDEVTENGVLNTKTGANQANDNALRTKNYVSVLPNTSYYCSALSGSGYAIWCMFYDNNKNVITGYSTGKSTYDNACEIRNSSFVTPSNCSYIRFYITPQYGNTYLNNISINYPSTDTAYHPYSNVRPIHGFSEVNATRAGKNLLDKILLVRGASSQPFLCKFGVDSFFTNIPNGSIVLASGQYTFSCFYKNDRTQNNVQLSVYDENGNNLLTRYTIHSITFTVPKSMAVCFYINCGAGLSFTSWNDYDIQLEAGSTATEYESYQGNTYTIDLDGTRYGGTVDVLCGLMRVTHSIITLDGITNGFTGVWGLKTNGYAVNYSLTALGGVRTNCFSDKFVYSALGYNYMPLYSCGGSSGGTFACTFILPDTITSLSEANAWLVNNPTTLCFKLETPIEVQLTPVQIETLVNTNNIYADTGDTAVEYFKIV